MARVENSVVWPLRELPSRVSDRRRSLARRLALLLLLLAAIAATLPSLGVPFFWPERAPADLVLVANLKTPGEVRRVEEMADRMREASGLHSVELRLDRASAAEGSGNGVGQAPEAPPGPRRLDQDLEAMLQSRADRAKMVVAIRPFLGDADPRHVADLAARCKRAGIAVGGIIPPPESDAGLHIALPTRLIPQAPGPFGTVSLFVRNLDMVLPEPGGALYLDLIAHGGRPFLPGELGGSSYFPNMVVPTGSIAATDRVRLDLGELPPSLKAAPMGSHNHLMIYPTEDGGIFHEPFDTLEAALISKRAGVEREIDRRVVSIATEPPKGLYVSLASMINGDRTRHLDPVLPQRPERSGMQAPGRPPWNLLWLDEGHRGGLTVYWPTERVAIPPSPGKVVRELPDSSEKLGEYDYVILDGSIVRSLDHAFDLKPVAPGMSTSAPSLYDWRQAQSFGGVIGRAGGMPDASTPVPITAWRTFRDALVKYWKEGGTVVVIGGSRDAFEDSLPVASAEGETIRDILAAFDPQLAQLDDGPEPRRVLLASDSVEQSAREPFPIFPELTDADQPLPSGSSEWYASQLRIFLGEGDVDGKVAGRDRRLRRLAARMALAGDTGGMVDPEFLTLLKDVIPGSAQEASLLCIMRLATLLVHPSVLVEWNGQPIWKGAGSRSSPIRGEDFLRPFPPGTGTASAGIPYSDLFSTLYPRLGTSTSGWPSAIASLSWLDIDRPADSLVDGMNLTRFSQYLRDQFDKSPSSPVIPLPSLAYGFFHRAEAEGGPEGPSGQAWWPLISAARSPAPRENASFHKAIARDRHRLFFLGRRRASWNPSRFFEFPGTAPPTWGTLLSATDDDLDSRRLLHMGAGRLARIVEVVAARDLQSIATRTKPDLARRVMAEGGEDMPEAVDTLRRTVHERFRLAAVPAVSTRSNTRWAPLIHARVGEIDYPVASVAAAPPLPDPGKSRGKIILLAFDPWYEANLASTGDLSRRPWDDFTATTVFRSGWVDGEPTERAPAEPPRFGYHLVTPSPLPSTESATFHITPHELTNAGNLHLLKNATSPGASPKMRAIAWPDLGLNRTSIGLSIVEPLSVEAREVQNMARAKMLGAVVRELVLGTTSESVIPLSREGVIFIMTAETAKALMTQCGVPNSAPPWPMALPPLLEFRFEADGAEEVDFSAFAPLLPQFIKTQNQDTYHSITWNYAPPAIQVIDTLLELFGRRPDYRATLGEEGESIRLFPSRAGAPRLDPGRVTIAVDVPPPATPVPLASTDVTKESPLPGQLRVSVRRDSTLFGKPLRVGVVEGGREVFSRRFVLPGPVGGGPPVPRPVDASPDEFARPYPFTSGLAMETLAQVTLPTSTLGKIEEGGNDSPESWTEAHRGLLFRPVNTEDLDPLRQFVSEFVRLRTQAKHERTWYLMSLGLMVLAIVSRRYSTGGPRSG